MGARLRKCAKNAIMAPRLRKLAFKFQFKFKFKFKFQFKFKFKFKFQFKLKNSIW